MMIQQQLLPLLPKLKPHILCLLNVSVETSRSPVELSVSQYILCRKQKMVTFCFLKTAVDDRPLTQKRPEAIAYRQLPFNRLHKANAPSGE